MKAPLYLLLLTIVASNLLAVERSTEYLHELVASFKVDDLGVHEKNLKRELLSLDLGSPANDLAAATTKGDYRFRSVAGFSVNAPLSEPFHYLLISKYGTRLIDGTTDILIGLESEFMNKIAYRYALAYNDLLLKKIIANKPHMRLVSFTASEPAKVRLLNSEKEVVFIQKISPDKQGIPLWIFSEGNLLLEPQEAVQVHIEK